ncbi:MAG: transglutaminase domain-containing protein [Alistipes sp.]|nr:transglutaminase domain-containing protein [Alistipes senegalensis]MCM1249858.1 transglutaminase domain-containing protein [Alistipes sp.]
MKINLALLFSFLLLGFRPVAAQDYSELLKPLDTLSERSRQAQEAGRYGDLLRCREQQIRFFGSLPDSVRRDLDAWNGGDWLAGQYYNLACAQSLSGRRRAAVASLEKAYDHGYFEQSYSAYGWMLRDPDLDPIRAEKGYEALRLKAAGQGDFIGMLRAAQPYDDAQACDSLPAFRYADPDDRNLVRLRQQFNLDSIAGAGDEISKIRNLCHWVHNTVRHDGGSYNPTERNAIAMIELCRREGRGVNCRMLAQILNECYLAMGFKSRFVTCMPRKMVNDCHVINVVYLNTLGKWVWIDPSFEAWVTDSEGTMLSIAEVRECLREGKPCFLNREANWNNEEPQTQEDYLETYMAKNLYYVVCSDRSEFDTETYREGKRPLRYVALVPPGYETDVDCSTSNDAWFWQRPYAERER